MRTFDAEPFFKYAPRDKREHWKATCSASSQADISHLKPIEKDFKKCSDCGGSGIMLAKDTGRKKTYKPCNCKG